MKDKKLKKIVSNTQLLMYVHDMMSLKDKDKLFVYSDTYKTIYEKKYFTYLNYLKNTMMVSVVFYILIHLLKQLQVHMLTVYIQYPLIFFISLIFGKCIIRSLIDIKELMIQLKATKAVRYVLERYTYEDFVLTMDQYLSSVSSLQYYTTHKIKNKKI